MPWIGIYEGEKKGPWQVPRQTDVECPSCGGRMRVWSESENGADRHFGHIDNIGGSSQGGRAGVDCDSVAESDEHLKWKNLAAKGLAEAFEISDDDIYVELGLDAPVSSKNRRVADAAVIFPERDEQLGKGLVVEVQHKNVNKDIEATTADYINQDFSVVWTEGSDYGQSSCKLAEIDFRQYAKESAWPDYVPSEKEWESPQTEFRNIYSWWRDAYREGLVESGAPATLPPDWNDETALEIWRSQDWNDIVKKHSIGTLEFTDEETWHVDDYLADLARKPSERSVEAAIPSEYFDQLEQFLYRWTPWEDLFSTPDSAKHRVQAAIPWTDPTRSRVVKLPPNSVDTYIYTNSEWEALFSLNDVNHPTKAPVVLELDFASYFSEGFWLRAYRNGKSEERAELEKPPSPYDDVQCHSCGNYRYAPNAGEECPNCGEEYDWFWNVNTNRVSRDSIPNQLEDIY